MSAPSSMHTPHIDAAGACTIIVPLHGLKGFVVSLPVAGSDRYTLDPTKLVDDQGEFSTENIFAVSETQIVVVFPGFE